MLDNIRSVIISFQLTTSSILNHNQLATQATTLNILRTKNVFKVEMKTTFIIFKGFSVTRKSITEAATGVL